MITDSNPIQIQKGDYILRHDSRGDRLLYIEAIEGEGNAKVYRLRLVDNWYREGENIGINAPDPILGRLSILRETTRLRDKRYVHLPAASVSRPGVTIAESAPVEVPEVPANDPIPTDPHPDLVAALERNTRMVARLVASVDLLREAIEKHGIRGQLTIPALVKAVG